MSDLDEQMMIRIAATCEDMDAATREAQSKLEALTESVEAVGEAAKVAGELFGVAFTLDGIKSAIEEVIQLGAQMERTAQITGMTTEQLSALKLVGEESNVQFGQLQMAVTMFSRSISNAEQGAGQAGRAFAALGISQRELQQHGNDTGAMLEEVARKLDAFGGGANKTALEMALFGRAGRQVDEMLHNLAEQGMKGAEDHAQQLGVLIGKELAEQSHQAEVAIVDFDNAVKGLKVELTAGLMPAVTGIVHWFQDLVLIVEHNIEKFKEFIQVVDLMMRSFARGKIEMGSQGAGPSFKPAPIGEGMEQYGPPMPPAAAKPPAPQMQKPDRGGRGGGGGPTDDEITGWTKLDDAVRRATESVQEHEAVLKQTQQAAQTDIEGSARLQLATLQTEEAEVKASYTGRKDAYMDEYAKLSDIAHQEYEVQRTQYEQLAVVYANDAAKVKEYNLEKELSWQKYEQTIARLQEQELSAANKQEKTWETSFTRISNAAGREVMSMIKGQETFAQAALKLGENMVEGWISSLAKDAAEWVGHEAFKLATHSQFITNLLGLDAAGDATKQVTDKASVASDAGVAAAGTMASISAIPYIGPFMAPEMAAQAFAATMAFGSFDTGSWDVPSNQLAMVHAGEMIIPANVAGPMRGGYQGPTFASSVAGAAAGGGGENHTHLHIHAIDTLTGANFIKNNIGVIASGLATQVRNANTSLTSIASRTR
jgi:tRNA(Ser,Leu) C12 N-acetylase TAN1